jgi:hypothetical protein
MNPDETYSDSSPPSPAICLEIFTTGVLALECCFSNLMSAAV